MQSYSSRFLVLIRKLVCASAACHQRGRSRWIRVLPHRPGRYGDDFSALQDAEDRLRVYLVRFVFMWLLIDSPSQNPRYTPEEILAHAVKKRRSAAGDPVVSLRVQDEKERPLGRKDAKAKDDEEDEVKEEEDDEETSSLHVAHGYQMVKGQMGHGMEDYIVAESRKINNHDLGLYAIFDGHSGRDVADYLQSHLFDNILSQLHVIPSHLLYRLLKPRSYDNLSRSFFIVSAGFLEKTNQESVQTTDDNILENVVGSRVGSAAVTAILIDPKKLVVANVGDSRAILCRKGKTKQITEDHEPEKEKELVESKGGFVSKKPGNVPPVDRQLGMTRAFGDGRQKDHITAVPDKKMEVMDKDKRFFILARDDLWKVMSSEEAFDCVKEITDAEYAAKELIKQALARDSKDDVSCIVVSFR